MESAAPGAAPRLGSYAALATYGALAFAGSSVLNLAGFVFHVIASRALGPQGYGTLYTVVSVAVIATLPAALVAPAISRLAAESNARDAARTNRLARALFDGVALVALAYVGGFLAMGAPLGAVLHVPPWTLWAAGPLAASMCASAAFRALAQGAHRFGAYSLSASGEGIAKVLGIAVLIALGMRLPAAIFGFFAGALCGALLAIAPWLRAAKTPAREGDYDRARIARAGFGAAAMVVALSAMGSVDVVLVKHYFGAQEAGIYAATALVGKIVLYLVGFVPVVLLPAVTASHTAGERSASTLYGALGAYAVIAVASVTIIGAAATGLLHVLVGHAFDAAAPLLLWYAGAMALLALANIVASYGIATERIAFAVPIVAGTVGTLAAIALFHANLAQVTHVMLYGNSVVAISTVAAVALQSSRERRSPA